MTVYVDDMEAEVTPTHAPGRKYVMCHMIADDEEELHAMADRIGVARKWYQGDHYDITKSKRAIAVKAGAVELSMRVLSFMAVHRRINGTLPAPAEAARMVEARRPLRLGKGKGRL